MEPCHVSIYANQKVGVDAYCWLHRGAFTCSTELCLNIPTERYLDYCMHRIQLLRHCKVEPVLVFDGARLPIKRHTEERRARSRSSNKAKGLALYNENKEAATKYFQKAVTITPLMAKALIERCKKAGVEYIVAPYEADAQLAYLAQSGYVSGVISEDSDLLIFGCPRVFYKMDKGGNGEELRLEQLGHVQTLSMANWNLDMLRAMCIFSGCDYLESLPGMGLKKAHGLVLQHRQWQKAMQRLRLQARYRMPSDYEERFRQANLTFLHQRVWDIKAKSVVHLTPLTPDLVQLSPEQIEFLGPALSPEVALKAAMGDIDPETLQPFPVEVKHQDGFARKVIWKNSPMHSSSSFSKHSSSSFSKHSSSSTSTHQILDEKAQPEQTEETPDISIYFSKGARKSFVPHSYGTSSAHTSNSSSSDFSPSTSGWQKRKPKISFTEEFETTIAPVTSSSSSSSSSSSILFPAMESSTTSSTTAGSPATNVKKWLYARNSPLHNINTNSLSRIKIPPHKKYMPQTQTPLTILRQRNPFIGDQYVQTQNKKRKHFEDTSTTTGLHPTVMPGKENLRHSSCDLNSRMNNESEDEEVEGPDGDGGGLGLNCKNKGREKPIKNLKQTVLNINSPSKKEVVVIDDEVGENEEKTEVKEDGGNVKRHRPSPLTHQPQHSILESPVEMPEEREVCGGNLLPGGPSPLVNPHARLTIRRRMGGVRIFSLGRPKEKDLYLLQLFHSQTPVHPLHSSALSSSSLSSQNSSFSLSQSITSKSLPAVSHNFPTHCSPPKTPQKSSALRPLISITESQPILSSSCTPTRKQPIDSENNFDDIAQEIEQEEAQGYNIVVDSPPVKDRIVSLASSSEVPLSPHSTKLIENRTQQFLQRFRLLRSNSGTLQRQVVDSPAISPSLNSGLGNGLEHHGPGGGDSPRTPKTPTTPHTPFNTLTSPHSPLFSPSLQASHSPCPSPSPQTSSPQTPLPQLSPTPLHRLMNRNSSPQLCPSPCPPQSLSPYAPNVVSLPPRSPSPSSSPLPSLISPVSVPLTSSSSSSRPVFSPNVPIVIEENEDSDMNSAPVDKLNMEMPRRNSSGELRPSPLGAAPPQCASTPPPTTTTSRHYIDLSDSPPQALVQGIGGGELMELGGRREGERREGERREGGGEGVKRETLTRVHTKIDASGCSYNFHRSNPPTSLVILNN